MNIRFQNIELHNFLSFEQVSCDLDKQGFILVKGINQNSVDNASSNGSGKSALFDGIFWILTGETIRGSKDVANVYANCGVHGKLVFSVDNDQYQIIRSKDDFVYRTNLKIIKNDIDISGKGIRDSEKILDSELPDVTSQLLSAVVLLGQGLPQRFSNNTPAGRKEVLETLSKSDFMIEDLKSRFAKRKSQVQSLQRSLEDQLLRVTTQKESLDKQIVTLHKQKEAINFISNEDYFLKKTLLEKTIDDLNDSISTDQKTLSQKNELLDSYLKTFYAFPQERDSKVKSIQDEYEDKIGVLDRTRLEIESKLHLLNDQINQYKNIQEYCPVCKQRLPDVHKIDTTELENEAYNIKKTHSNVMQELRSVQQEMYDRCEKVMYNCEQECISMKKVIDEIKHDITRLNTSLTELNKNLEVQKRELNTLEVQFTSQSEMLEQIEEQLTNAEQDLENLQNEILYINGEVEKIKSRQTVLSQINSILTRDFRGVLLVNVIEYIQSRCKEYSRKLFNTDLIEFKLDGNKLCISYDSKEYELLSGGERQKIDIIVQFSLRDMLCKFLNFSSNILVLDEILDNLDEDGSQRVLDLITTSLNDVECIYIISHRQDFNIPFDGEVVVMKGEDKISRLL